MLVSNVHLTLNRDVQYGPKLKEINQIYKFLILFLMMFGFYSLFFHTVSREDFCLQILE